MSMKKVITLIAAVGILAAAGAAYAATFKKPAEIVAGLTGKSVETLAQERATGKTYGTIAKEAGKLDEFKAQVLEQKKAILDQRVKDGQLTQAQADEIYNAIKDNQATCDGTGSTGIGRKCGVGFGRGNGQGRGMGLGFGQGNGNCGGLGRGCGLNNSK